MPFFSRNPRPPAYVVPSGAVTVDRAQFSVVMRTRPIFSKYVSIVGLDAARTALDNCFTENLRCMSASGFWSYGTNARYGNPDSLRFQDDATLNNFIQTVELFFEFDLDLIDKRGKYINGLKGKADAGLLLQDLRANSEPEGNYYVAPVPKPQREGSPLVPPKPAALINQSKGLAWLTHGVQGDTAAFKRLLLRSTKTDGSFPLGADSRFLFRAWSVLVPHAPNYRGWNPAAALGKYPSNVGGTKVLNDTLTGLFNSPMPPQRDDAWYGLALYMMGSIITTQAFTDGNKRMSRFAYVLMLLSGGVDMIVPNNVLGATLGDM